MKSIRYVEIENFKTFGKSLRIELGHPAVIIGPNNAGKTSVIQALALWSRGVKSWFERKGQPRKTELERVSAGINRLNILDVPVSENRYFWNATRVRKSNVLIPLTINVGLEFQGQVHDCRLIFTYRDTEILYCKPDREAVKKDGLLEFAATLQFNLLYPMSGIMAGISAETEETPLPDGRINVFLGQGQTAQVLRNICYKVAEQDKQNRTDDWQKIVDLIQRLFMVQLGDPIFNEARGSLRLSYKQQGVDAELDISLAGRGLQQLLLILSYLYWHKNSILLIDEPDAHLEILRQKQVYQILKEVAAENKCQVVLATHSEVVIDDAVDTNLTLLINGEAVNLATQQDMKNALRSFGIEHYYKARVRPRILYIEGETDIGLLKALAKKLGHPAEQVLSEQINCYYTCNNEPEDGLENRLDRVSGSFGNIKPHFYALKKFVPDFKGLAILDCDARNRQSEIDEKNLLCISYWQDYEIENTFVTPELIEKFVDAHFSNIELFRANSNTQITGILDSLLLENVFSNDTQQLRDYKNAGAGLRRTLLRQTKLSALAEEAFRRFAQARGESLLLTKGEFYQLIDFLQPDEISPEVREKLDLVVTYLSM